MCLGAHSCVCVMSVCKSWVCAPMPVLIVEGKRRWRPPPLSDATIHWPIGATRSWLAKLDIGRTQKGRRNQFRPWPHREAVCVCVAATHPHGRAYIDMQMSCD